MDYEEQACSLDCAGQQLIGILTLPLPDAATGGDSEATATPAVPGILMLVGGAQYRSGSHRQFTLLARSFAAAGFPVMRVDFHGMGDSQGDTADFETFGPDIDCALSAFSQAVPTLAGVVLWGLCDGASAALLHGHADARVRGMVLVNPWARTESGQAQAYLKHYYRSRLWSRDLWGKILRGRFDAKAALLSLWQQMRRALSGSDPAAQASLPDRLQRGYEGFGGPVLLILSGQDLTAREFADLATPGSRWEALLQAERTTRLDLPEANHTFSTRSWRQEVAQATLQWLARWRT